MLRNPRGERSRWLGAAFLVEGLVFLQYVPSLAPQLWGAPPLFNYVRYSSFFDAVAELLIALASLVALQDRIVEELRYANEELVASQERLRQLVDLDPLTSLMNRRGLPARAGPGRDLRGGDHLPGHQQLQEHQRPPGAQRRRRLPEAAGPRADPVLPGRGRAVPLGRR